MIKNKQDEKLRYIFRNIALLILFAWVLMHLSAVLEALGRGLSLISPFLIGGAMAFVINIILRPLEHLYKKICKKAPEKLARPVCLALSTLVVFGIFFAAVFMMIPSLQKSCSEFVRNIPAYADKTGDWWDAAVHFAAKYNIVLPEFTIDSKQLIENVTEFINREGSGILTVTLGAASSIISVSVNVLMAFVFAIYLLAKKEAVASHLKKIVVTLLPESKANRLLHIVELTNHTFTNFVSGQLTEAVIIGVLCFLGMVVLRIPYASAISVFVAVTALIPVFGAWLGGGFGIFLIVLADPVKALWFIIFLIILQQTEGNLIYPKVVGESVGLPGLLVLMSVTLGGGALGILGMLFGVPVCAVVYSLYLEFMKSHEVKEEKKMQC